MIPLLLLAPAAITAVASGSIPQIPESITLEDVGSISATLAPVAAAPRDPFPWERPKYIGPKNYGKRDASLHSRSNRRKR